MLFPIKPLRAALDLAISACYNIMIRRALRIDLLTPEPVRGLLLVALCILVSSIGCSTVQKKQRHTSVDSVFVPGSGKWFDLDTLKDAADEEIKHRGRVIGAKGLFVTATFPYNSTNMLMLQYFEGFGLPMYYVGFSSNGIITSVDVREASEGR